MFQISKGFRKDFEKISKGFRRVFKVSEVLKVFEVFQGSRVQGFGPWVHV